MTRVVLVILMAYLLVCISAGYLVVILATGRDIRTHASGSTGSRNVVRMLGIWGFLLTLACDAGKGALPGEDGTVAAILYLFLVAVVLFAHRVNIRCAFGATAWRDSACRQPDGP